MSTHTRPSLTIIRTIPRSLLSPEELHLLFIRQPKSPFLIWNRHPDMQRVPFNEAGPRKRPLPCVLEFLIDIFSSFNGRILSESSWTNIMQDKRTLTPRTHRARPFQQIFKPFLLSVSEVASQKGEGEHFDYSSPVS